ncbi:MAG: HepT-like ribonuclease domain-containing protein [Bacillota bacterium]
MKDDKLYLVHISECIGRIEKYVVDGKEVFMTSTLIQDAVLRNLQTLAESTQRLSGASKAAHPEVDWYKISGFRNVLVHDYLGVDLERVWKVIERDLPGLKRSIISMLK